MLFSPVAIVFVVVLGVAMFRGRRMYARTLEISADRVGVHVAGREAVAFVGSPSGEGVIRGRGMRTGSFGG